MTANRAAVLTARDFYSHQRREEEMKIARPFSMADSRLDAGDAQRRTVRGENHPGWAQLIELRKDSTFE
jgi:hypothetical protein